MFRCHSLTAFPTKYVVRSNGRLAVRARRMEAVAAGRTVVDLAIHNGLTLRTRDLKRGPQNEIEDETNSVGNEDDNERPECAAHPAPAGIAVHVTDHQDPKREECGKDN